MLLLFLLHQFKDPDMCYYNKYLMQTVDVYLKLSIYLQEDRLSLIKKEPVVVYLDLLWLQPK